MTIEELKNKHNRFVERVRRMRGWQREYEIYRGSAEKQTKKMMEREIDNYIREEMRIIKSGQKELF